MPQRCAERLALGEPELADWRDAVGRIVTGLDPATGLYEQFAGYHKLEPLDLSLYADRKMPIDVVIGRERTQRSQVVKQADVVALLALLPDEFPGAAAKANFRYYEPRCAHGSSLSAGIHALVAARLGETETALRFLRQAAAADLELDPNSAGGIRIAGLGGLWQAIVLGFAGLGLKGDTLGIDPRLPPQWRSLSFRVLLEGPVGGDPHSWHEQCRRRWWKAREWRCGSRLPLGDWLRARHWRCRYRLLTQFPTLSGRNSPMIHHERLRPPSHDYPADEWNVIEKRFHPEFLAQLETMLALGNGYLGMRGCPEEGGPNAENSTLINGFYETRPIVYPRRRLWLRENRPDHLQRDRQQDNQALRR